MLKEKNALVERLNTTGPQMYKVVMHNDDYTPMDFVVAVLERFFNMDTVIARQLMITVHTVGQAICGVFSLDIAETKIQQVTDFAIKCEHPLLCSLEGV